MVGRRGITSILVAGAIAGGTVVAAVITGGGGGAGCTLTATTGTFASQVAAATAGQTVCLDSGSYGTWA
ncbi:MAG: hypothetical protein JWR61_5880, partial [Ferruginibacter sp.]|uniref:hypothetical protein n=1 Tax=Ferruginibacter sp. TaxID=1940288 RepID=UPI002659813C